MILYFPIESSDDEATLKFRAQSFSISLIPGTYSHGRLYSHTVIAGTCILIFHSSILSAVISILQS